MNRLMRIVAPITLGVTVVLAGATPALAADVTLDRVKHEVTRRIDLRLGALKQYDFTVNNAKHISGEHKSTLHTLITEDIAGLTALKSKVEGETTREAIRADAVSMVTDYRVFILVGPKVRLTVISDAETAAITRLASAHDKLADLVAKAKAAGQDTAAAEADLSDMQAALDKARTTVDGQVATLLGIQPGPNADQIKSQVLGVRGALRSTRADLKTAVAEAKHVRDFLKSVKPTPTAAG